MLGVQIAIALLLAIAGVGHWVGWTCLGLVYVFSACFNISWGAVGTLYPGGEAVAHLIASRVQMHPFVSNLA